MPEQHQSHKKHKMHTAWGIWWWFWGTGMVIGMLFSAVIPDYWWCVAFGAFLIPEVIGAAVKNRKGDTFSESIWTISQHAPALRLFAAILGVAITGKAWTLFNIIALLAGVEYHWWERLPWDILMGGCATWLVFHFLYVGRKG